MAEYPPLAERLMPAALRIASALGSGQGRRAIDVAAGNGNVAACLHQQGWSVHATDVSQHMVELGRRRTGPTVHWDVAAAERLPTPDHSVAAVVSNFGLIFADVDQMVAEVHRVLRPDGVLVFTAWTTDSYMATMTDVLLRHLPGPPHPSPLAWGDPDVARARLAGLRDVDVQRDSLPWNFDSPAQAREFYERCSPAHAAAIASLAPPAATAMMDAVESHLAELTDTGGRVRIDADYLIVSAHPDSTRVARQEISA